LYQQFLIGEDCALKTQVTTRPLTCGVLKKTQLANPWKDGVGQAKKEGKRDKSPKRTPSLMPDASLQELKDTRPWYQGVESGVLQLISSRVNESFNKFFKGAGLPKFKPSHDFNSFSYKPGRIKSL
jgi:putative transposase